MLGKSRHEDALVVVQHIEEQPGRVGVRGWSRRMWSRKNSMKPGHAWRRRTRSSWNLPISSRKE
eukprot:13258824-Alexandrium_andersonii.AAC.1